MTPKFARHSEEVASSAHGLSDLREFDALATRHHGKVFGVGLAWLHDKDAAEDLTQEVLLRAYLYVNGGGKIACFSAWCGTVARNMAINWIRSGRRRSALLEQIPMLEMPMESPDNAQLSPRDHAQQIEEASQLEAALNRLSPALREVVILHYVEGCSKTDIGRVTGQHASTVGRSLDRALRELRVTMEEAPALMSPLREGGAHRQQRVIKLLVGIASLSLVSKAALAVQCGDTMQLLHCDTAVVGHSLTGKGILAAITAKPIVAVVLGAATIAAIYTGSELAGRDSRKQQISLVDLADTQSRNITGRPQDNTARLKAATSTATPMTPFKSAARIQQAAYTAPINLLDTVTTGAGTVGSSDTMRLPFRVVDNEALPVAGASVRIVALFELDKAGQRAMTQGVNISGTAVTDSDGFVSLNVPRLTGMGTKTDGVGLQTEHPDFSTTVSDVILRAAVPIVLSAGNSFALQPIFENGQTVPRHGIEIVASDSAKVTSQSWTSRADGTWLAQRLPDGSHYLYVKHTTEDSKLYYSDMTSITVPCREHDPLRIMLHPSFTLKGSLDANVPRPVREGKVQVHAEAAVNNTVNVSNSSELSNQVFKAWEYGEQTRGMKYGWADPVDVNADGTFELPGLPRTALRMVCTCEGWVSAEPETGLETDGVRAASFPPGAPSSVSEYLKVRSWSARLVPYTGDQPIEVPMARTGNVRLRLHAKDGRPITSATVTVKRGILWHPHTNLTGNWTGGNRSGITNETGEVLITSIAPGWATIIDAKNDGVWISTKRSQVGPADIKPRMAPELLEIVADKTVQKDIELEPFDNWLKATTSVQGPILH